MQADLAPGLSGALRWLVAPAAPPAWRAADACLYATFSLRALAPFAHCATRLIVWGVTN